MWAVSFALSALFRITAVCFWVLAPLGSSVLIILQVVRLFLSPTLPYFVFFGFKSQVFVGFLISVTMYDYHVPAMCQWVELNMTVTHTCSFPFLCWLDEPAMRRGTFKVPRRFPLSPKQWAGVLRSGRCKRSRYAIAVQFTFCIPCYVRKYLWPKKHKQNNRLNCRSPLVRTFRRTANE